MWSCYRLWQVFAQVLSVGRQTLCWWFKEVKHKFKMFENRYKYNMIFKVNEQWAYWKINSSWQSGTVPWMCVCELDVYCLVSVHVCSCGCMYVCNNLNYHYIQLLVIWVFIICDRNFEREHYLIDIWLYNLRNWKIVTNVDTSSIAMDIYWKQSLYITCD